MGSGAAQRQARHRLSRASVVCPGLQQAGQRASHQPPSLASLTCVPALLPILPLCQAAWFPFVRCLAEPLTGNLTATDRASYVEETSALVEEAAPICAQEHGFDLDALLECAQGVCACFSARALGGRRESCFDWMRCWSVRKCVRLLKSGHCLAWRCCCSVQAPEDRQPLPPLSCGPHSAVHAPPATPLSAAGPEGAELEAEAAAATAQLQPAHLGVPWVTVAEQSLGGNTPTLAATGLFVCAAAPANARPPACEQLALDVNKDG